MLSNCDGADVRPVLFDPVGLVAMFVRFVVGTDAENQYWLDGVFTVAASLREEGELFEYELAQVVEIFAWFNLNLPCPPFSKKLKSGEWTRDAVSWFRDDASEPMGRIWDLVAILKHHGEPVRLVKTESPGRIVYQDTYQIVAETNPWTHRLSRHRR